MTEYCPECRNKAPHHYIGCSLLPVEFVNEVPMDEDDWKQQNCLAANRVLIDALEASISDENMFKATLLEALRAKHLVPQFPLMLRKMWSGREVQEWINDHFGGKP